MLVHGNHGPLTMAQNVLVLDFDGTVCLGDDPVIEYARAVIRRLPVARQAEDGSALISELACYLRGAPSPDLAASPDGYYAVAVLAERLGIDESGRNEAYLESRTAVHDGSVPVTSPHGLADLLRELRPLVRVVLVTNAPENGAGALLHTLGFGGLFDEVVGDARKPSGMIPILDRLLDQNSIVDSPWRLLSVGDIWENDLEPARSLGCRTALIDRWGRAPGQPDESAASMPELYPAIAGWAREVSESAR